MRKYLPVSLVYICFIKIQQTKNGMIMKNGKGNNQVLFELEASKFQWEIAAGKSVEAWGFNRQLPGPVLRARKGDRVVVKLKNNLEEPTMIHWHGIRLPASMDGTGVVQKPVGPGEEFEYSFVVPDAGTYWYHSHHNETVQMERGMYGALIVEDDSDPVTDGEQVFLIDDMKLTSENEFTTAKGYLAKSLERHDGREGNIALLNGKEDPVIEIAAGQLERWRFINAASARYFLLHMEGRTFNIMGTDGGLLETPKTVNQVMIVPGERMDIIAGPFREGESFSIETLPYNRRAVRGTKKTKYASVKVGEARPSRASIPFRLRNIVPLAPQDAEVTRKVELDTKPSLKNGANFYINKEVHANDKPVRVGELQVWEISNISLMDHPFHLHGFFFQVLEVNGKAPEYRAWKDTINVGPRSKVKIALLPDNRPGMWMYHCHILEHHEAGMMANFQVISANEPEPETMSGGHCHA